MPPNRSNPWVDNVRHHLERADVGPDRVQRSRFDSYGDYAPDLLVTDEARVLDRIRDRPRGVLTERVCPFRQGRSEVFETTREVVPRRCLRGRRESTHGHFNCWVSYFRTH